MNQLPRVIAHLDMDAFYASVELLRYPELRAQPLGNGGASRHQPLCDADPPGAPPRRFTRLRDYVGRGVITTATYEARAFGVHSAMGLMKAAQKAPDAILLPTDFDEYRKYSRLFKAAVQAIAPHVEDRGIDEMYIDLSELVAVRMTSDDDQNSERAIETWWSASEIARELKQAVRDATGLSCSIGLAPNKLIAKIASELDKPDGLAIVTEREIESRLWPMPVRRLHGVGPKATAKLARLGISQIGELAQADREWLTEHFGKAHAFWMHDAAHGRDDRPVVTYSEPKSISRETTFDRDLHAVRDRSQLTQIFTELCAELSGDLRRKRYAGRTIGIKLRFEDFKTVTRDKSLPAPVSDATEIRRAAGECLKRVDLTKRIRLLGVRADKLVLSDSVIGDR